VVRHDYRIGVPADGVWRECLNTDARHYGGGDVGNQGEARTRVIGAHGRPWSLTLTLPPLATLFFLNGEGVSGQFSESPV